jgi:hypothetical protein
MAFSNIVDMALVINIEKRDMEEEAIIRDIEQQILVVFSELNQFELKSFA